MEEFMEYCANLYDDPQFKDDIDIILLSIKNNFPQQDTGVSNNMDDYIDEVDRDTFDRVREKVMNDNPAFSTNTVAKITEDLEQYIVDTLH